MTDRTRSISERVIVAVAEEEGVDPIDLDPLYGTVDPECLEDLFRTDPSVAGHDPNYVRFRHSGSVVTVTSDGTVTVSAASDRPDSATDDVHGDPSTFPESPD